MKPEEITDKLTELFGAAAVQITQPGAWQVETPQLRLLVLLSEDKSWLRILIPIAPALEAQAFFEQLLQANFDDTQETRYALNQNVLWGVFQHNCETLEAEDFSGAVARLVSLRQRGLDDSFDQLVDSRIRQIIQAAKQQGQSLEATLQTLDRFYREGLMGDLEQGQESREQVMQAWQRRLETLWSQVEP
jgi:predicted negative regulator of RcsB-dependent stress response